MKEYGNLIYNENQKLQRQVDNLLDLAAIEWEEFEYVKKQEDLNNLVKDAINAVKLLIEEKKGKLKDNGNSKDNEWHFTYN